MAPTWQGAALPSTQHEASMTGEDLMQGNLYELPVSSRLGAAFHSPRRVACLTRLNLPAMLHLAILAGRTTQGLPA
eukprot:667118-Prorocentrum_minimum.AAC.4